MCDTLHVMIGAGWRRESLRAFALAAGRIVDVNALGCMRRLGTGQVSTFYWCSSGMGADLFADNDIGPPEDRPCDISIDESQSDAGGAVRSLLMSLGARRVLTVPLPGAAHPLLFWISTARSDPFSAEQVRALAQLVAVDAGVFDRPESVDAELVRLRRLERVDAALPEFFVALEVQDLVKRVSDSIRGAAPHDLLRLSVLSDDRARSTTYVTGGLDSFDVRRIPNREPAALRESCRFEIWDDLSVAGERDAEASPRALRSVMRIPIRSRGLLVGNLDFIALKSAAYEPADAAIGSRIADAVGLVLSHLRLAEESRRAATTATLELLDSLLADLTDTGSLPDVFDRLSAIARRVLPHDMLLMAVAMPDGRHARTYACSGTDPFQVSDVWEIPSEILEHPKWDDEVCDEMSAHPMWRRYDAPKRGYRSAIHLLIRFDGALAASLAFFSFAPAAYTPADLLVARRIRDRVALSLARERGAEASRRAGEASARASLLEDRVRALTDELNARAGYRRIVGDSPAWRQALKLATQVASTQTTVLLLGESGTGKEVIARFIHGASPQSRGPFVALNCAALPEQLLEAELFGYERGAYTGATQSKPGQIEMAAGGVLFLDEVGEMSLPAQAKLLRVLQEREFLRLGGTRVLKTDARIVAASNRDLQKAMERGLFREDLYYRLNVFAIHLPPLRDRRNDVPPLTEAFVQEIGRAMGRPPAGVSREARQALMAYHWPGNVRELRNVLERAAILCDGALIAAEHLALGPLPAVSPTAAVAPLPATPAPPASAAPPADLKSVERALIVKALEDAHSNKSQAAKALGLTRAQLYVRLRKYGLDKDARRRKRSPES